MASIPLPALSIKPPANPLDEYARIIGIKGMLQQQGIQQTEAQRQQLALQKEQLSAKDDQIWRDTMHDWASQPNPDPQDLIKAGMKAGAGPQSTLAMQQGILAQRKTLADLDEVTLKNNAAKGDQYRGRILAVVNAPDDQKQALWDKELTAEEQAGILKPGVLSHAYPGDEPATALANHFALGSVLAKESIDNKAAEARSSQAQTAATRLTLEIPKIQAETANLPTPQEAQAQRTATLAKTQTETAKAGEELTQLKRQSADIAKPDATGFQSSLSVPEYNKRYDSFTKSKGFGQLQQLQGSYSQFQDVLRDLDEGKPLTGAASVTALFNAIGISAEPLAGKGFRINQSTVNEHIGARGLDQAAYQKLLSLKQGDVITPSQIKDYASIATAVYRNAYVINADEAHRQGLPADFLPQGGGATLDGTTAEIFARTVLHANPGLAKNPQALKAAVAQAAQKSGWDVQ